MLMVGLVWYISTTWYRSMCRFVKVKGQRYCTPQVKYHSRTASAYRSPVCPTPLKSTKRTMENGDDRRRIRVEKKEISTNDNNNASFLYRRSIKIPDTAVEIMTSAYASASTGLVCFEHFVVFFSLGCFAA